MKTSNFLRRSGSERHQLSAYGQSLTEFALMVMFMLLLLVGLVDIGRAFFIFMALRDSAQEGAVYGSINPTQTIDIKNHVLNSSDMIPTLISSSNIQVLVIGEPCTGNSIRVTVTDPDFPITMPFIGALIGSQTISISASVTDTILSPGCD